MIVKRWMVLVNMVHRNNMLKVKLIIQIKSLQCNNTLRQMMKTINMKITTITNNTIIQMSMTLRQMPIIMANQIFSNKIKLTPIIKYPRTKKRDGIQRLVMT